MGAPSPPLTQAVSDLHRAFFTGIVLGVVARRGPASAAELVFAVFRRQQRERFLPGLAKLGLTGLPHAVACAQYHYLSNRIGGVSVEYMRESDRKAWIRYAPPRWLWWGTALCAIPGEVSRAMLRGWHAQNGVSLGNPRLGFVCTKQAADGQNGLEGYYLEHDHDLAPEERLRFSRGEEAPDFDPAQAPWVPAAEWPEERLRKAHRGYAMEYVRTAIQSALEVFGPDEARHLLGIAGRQVGMQHFHMVAEAAGGADPGALGFARWMRAVAGATGESGLWTEERDGQVRLGQSGWALMRGVSHLHPAGFDCWTALWEGALAAHDRRLEIELEQRPVGAEGPISWSIHARRR
ncbi:hypothetical protein [Sabulicella rubraurantiaca]|uniref:hypothetical protein n=1 Tax=Sabulicella rubraurantiaca TaxID=2811429 RepID=UPI001A977245|nr:hypothetical protein [Sabulicella rubraurantiaca]